MHVNFLQNPKPENPGKLSWNAPRMDEKNILIVPLPLLWYLYHFLFHRLGKKRVTSIICPGKLGFLADVMGGGFPSMFQAFSRAGPRMMAMLLLTRPICIGLFTIPCWNRRCTCIIVEKDSRSHVSCKQYPCTLMMVPQKCKYWPR